MADPFTEDAGARHAFASSPDPMERSLHRIRIVFEASDGRVWTTGTNLIAPTLDSAADSCDALNSRLGYDHDGWSALAERVFAAQAQLSGTS